MLSINYNYANKYINNYFGIILVIYCAQVLNNTSNNINILLILLE